MYQSNLNKILNHKNKQNFPKALMLFGEEHFLINFYAQKITSHLNTDEIQKLYLVDYDFNSAKSLLSQNSLFGETSLLIIETEKKLDNKQLKELILRASKSQNNYFLYLYFGDDFKASFKSFQPENGVSSDFVRFFKMNYEDIWIFLKNEISLKNIQIEDKALNLLIHYKDTHIELILAELKKLSILNKNIEEQDIVDSVYILENIKFEKFLVHFLTTGDFLGLLDSVSNQNIEPTVVIIYLIRLIEELILRRINYENRENYDSVTVLKRKLPPQIDSERMRITLQNDLNRLQKLLSLVLTYEYKYRSGMVADKYSIFIAMLSDIKNNFF
jgi:DNA polymerase-3 subunit delta